ncbi:hypothetical protein [Amaricoccus macauensis]|uniref:hypothetical protein n=1 Tax=Amaricoccus macauensis TaxID=57001 RepID=UPI003C7D90DE
MPIDTVSWPAPKASDPARDAAAANRDRAFELARWKAVELSWNMVFDEANAGPDGEENPEFVERYRWLIFAMGLARSSPGGDAVAALARRGYLISRQRYPGMKPSQIVPISAFHIVSSRAGLPSSGTSPWSTIERKALAVDVETLPVVRVVSAHVTLRVKAELRKEGVGLG